MGICCVQEVTACNYCEDSENLEARLRAHTAVAENSNPKTLLRDELQHNIRKNTNKLSKKYDALDEAEKETARNAFKVERDGRTEDFLNLLYRIAEHNEERAENNSWADAVQAWREKQVWEKVNTTIEEDLDVNEELIG